MKVRSGGGHLPELVGGVVLALRLPGLGLHPSLALWLVFPPLPGHDGHGGHLPELVGGVVLAPLLHGLVLHPVHPKVPGGGHRCGLDHGGRVQQDSASWQTTPSCPGLSRSSCGSGGRRGTCPPSTWTRPPSCTSLSSLWRTSPWAGSWWMGAAVLDGLGFGLQCWQVLLLGWGLLGVDFSLADIVSWQIFVRNMSCKLKSLD